MADKCMNLEKRLPYMDLMRILAICFVVFNHTGERGYMLFAERMDSAMYIPYMLISIFCKIAVPIFFMISGALLLHRQEPLKILFCRRVLRMVVVLIVISVPYFAWLHGARKLDMSSFLMTICSQSASTSLWYLYSYIALLLMLPFLRNMVKSMRHQDYLYLILGNIVLVGILPCLGYLMWGAQASYHESFTPFIFMNQNVFFALIGYYFEHVFDYSKWTKRATCMILVANILALAITVFMTHYQTLGAESCTTTQMERFFNCFICIPTMTVYILLKSKGGHIKSGKSQRVLMIFGDAVFGVYLIEKFVRALTGTVYTALNPWIGSLPATIIWCLVVLGVSFLIIIPFKNIPGLKKLVNLFI